jgi:predicted DCC family thiol-disulfide oxidoreductase YuxK
MKIIFFDGYCNLCNGFVDWVVKRDTHAQFKFASLQSETAKKLLPIEISAQTTPESVILLKDSAYS